MSGNTEAQPQVSYLKSSLQLQLVVRLPYDDAYGVPDIAADLLSDSLLLIPTSMHNRWETVTVEVEGF